LKGFTEFVKDHLKIEGEEKTRKWLAKLGYDNMLFNKECRCFTLSFHSNAQFEVQQKAN
jgi:hypothetical protein